MEAEKAQSFFRAKEGPALMPENNTARPQRRARRRRSVWYAPLSFFLICAAMVFGMSVFFRVSVIEVTGSIIYSNEEIIEASGVKEGDNLFLINRSSAAASIVSKLPYVKNAAIDPKLPNRVIIKVTESSATAKVSLDGEQWIMDHGCKILGTGTYEEVAGLISILGITPVSASIGETLVVESSETPKVEYIAAVLRELSERGMQSDVSWLDMGNIGNPSFDYLGRFVVKLGTNENLRYKLDLLAKAMDQQLAEGDAGTIDLSGDGMVLFSPE